MCIYEGVNYMKRREKYFYNRLWFWFLIAGIVILNFLLLLFKNKNLIGVICTIISGWISGIATIFIGIIATIQNKKYKEENDDFMNKQYNFEKSKIILENRKHYINEINEQIKKFVKNNNYKDASIYLAELLLMKQNKMSSDSLTQPQDLYRISIELQSDYVNLRNLIGRDVIESNEKKNLINDLDNYYISYATFIEKLDYSNLQQQIEFNNSKIGNLHLELIKSFRNYIDFLDKDYMCSSIDKIEESDYLINHYKYAGK